MFVGNNIFSEICSKITAGVLPFIALGFIGDTLILYISLSIGTAAVIGLISSIVLRKKLRKHQSSKLIRVFDQDLSFPYAMALSSTILICNGIDAGIGLWFSLALFVLIFLSCLLPDRTCRKDMH